MLEQGAEQGGTLGRNHVEVDVTVLRVGVLSGVTYRLGGLERGRGRGRCRAVGAAVVRAGNGAVDGERFLPAGIGLRVEAIERPIAGLDGTTLLDDGVAESRTYAVVDTRTVGYDYGRAGIAFGLDERVDGLLIVGSESYRSHIDVAIGHHHAAEILFGGRFAVGRIFGDT